VNDFTRFLRAEWDRVAGYACLLAGAVALVFGFAGVRNAADVVDEISYLVTGGIGAVFLLGVGATLLLSADLHDDFRKLHRVEEKLDAVYRVLAAEHPELVDLEAPADRPPAAGPEAGAAAVDAPARVPAPAAPGLLAVRRFRRLAFGAIVVAGVLFVAGAIGTANEPATDGIARPVGLALTGAMLVAVVAGAMVGQLKGRLEHQQLAALGPWLASAGPSAAAPAGPASEVWTVDGLTLYHRAGCRALEGRNARAQAAATLAGDARPCGLCEPGPVG
jgi:hypothetical protein